MLPANATTSKGVKSNLYTAMKETSLTEQMLRNTALFLMVGFISLAIILSLTMFRGVMSYQAKLMQETQNLFTGGLEVEIIE